MELLNNWINGVNDILWSYILIVIGMRRMVYDKK